MSTDPQSFPDNFCRLTGYSPMRWQNRLFGQLSDGKIPSAIDLPTGLGKTSVMAIWLVARASAGEDALKAIPRRLVYIVDRRAVVDQATEVAEKLRQALSSGAAHLKGPLGLSNGTLPISTLRGAHVDNREWLDDPAGPAIVVGTIDMIGSRLLFEGYGVSRKMRPYHAGLLGADTLIVLDEAHLVPPFAELLQTIQSNAAFWPKDEAASWLHEGVPRPPFVVLPLSATQRERPAENGGRKPFNLEKKDISHDDFAERRINARKALRLEPPVAKDWDAALAAEAWNLAAKGGDCARVAVFCNRRDKQDDESTGPSVMGVLAELEKREKRDKLAFDYELLIGGRRIKERQKAADNLKRLGFAGGGPKRPDGPDKPTFLLATSAGEVGIDFDADHMVSDLAPWERMVQRLGRVNRRGGEGRQAIAVVFDTVETEKKNEDRKTRFKNTLALLKRIGDGGSLNSAALAKLRRDIGEATITEASSPEPLHPALTRALVDAWSMTSLERHTGRPDVAPWLRGWIENAPQTSVVWRTFLPVRLDEEDRQFVPKKDTNDFFEAAPPHESEKLESETFRIVEWMEERARILMSEGKAKTQIPEEEEEQTEAVETSIDDDTGDKAAEFERRALSATDIVALTLSRAGDFERSFTLGALARPRKEKREKDEFFGRFVERTLVLDSRFRGLAESGMLKSKSNGIVRTADTDKAWGKETGFRVRNPKEKGEQDTGEQREAERKVWHPEYQFVVRSRDDGDAEEWRVVEHYRSAAQSEEGRSVSRQPQELGKHQSQAEENARCIGKQLGLSGVALEVLALAARLHDEGKRAEIWQTAFRASRDAEKYGLTGPLAKTTGYLRGRLNDYRHEFGSLAVFDQGHSWRKILPGDVRERIADIEGQPEWFDLLQHLIVSHHGYARPVISTKGCEDAPPSALEERAREVALRFARLQKLWGPWGLAWWEALLRAADQQASRDNDRGEGLGAPRGETE